MLDTNESYQIRNLEINSAESARKENIMKNGGDAVDDVSVESVPVWLL